MSWRWLSACAILTLSSGRAAADGTSPAATRAKIVVGLSLPGLYHPMLDGLYHPVFDAGLRGAQRRAEALGVELVVTDAGYNAQTQAKDLAGLVARRVDGIVLWPPLLHREWMLPEVEAASSAGIPVAIANTPLAWDKALVFVTEDNGYSGRQVGSFLVERLQGSGSILEIEGPPEFAERKLAFEEVLSRSHVEVVARDDGGINRVRTRWVMARLLARHPKFDGVVAMNDEMMLGVLDAMRDAGIRPSTKVMVSLDYYPEAHRLIQTGDLAATFDPRFDHHTGQALDIMVAYLRRHATPPEKVVFIKGVLGVLACAPEVTTVRARAGR